MTAPHSSHQIGNVENANGYLKRKVRILLEESGLYKSFWKRNKYQDFVSIWLFDVYICEWPKGIFTKTKNGVLIGYDKSLKIALVCW